MKKKIKALLLMLVCIFALTACGETTVKPLLEDPHSELDEEVQEICALVVSLGSATAEELAYYDEMKIDEVEYLNQLLSQSYGVRTDFSIILKGAHSYADSKKLLLDNELENALPETGSITYDVDADQVIANVHFKTLKPNEGGHDGIVEIIYDKNLHVTAVTVNTILGLGESMQRAGTNTLIGMGTVFIMLILIAIIISMLKYVPKLLDAFKAPAEGVTEASVDKAIAGIVEREEAQQDEADDTELIAVIAAAIAAAGGESASTDGFVVRSIRRIR
ncbi:MAG: OadG family protein [Lachnospiraceae bacterium]|nr:OadG family protein [Lachnospiraceae bacterium]